MTLSRWEYYALDRVVVRIPKVQIVFQTGALTVGCLGVVFSAACLAFRAMDRDLRPRVE